MSYYRVMQRAATKLAHREGKRSQTRRADIMEILKLLVEEQVECANEGRWDDGILNALYVKGDEKAKR